MLVGHFLIIIVAMPGVGDGGTGIGQTTSRLVEPPWKNGTDMRRAMVERSLSYAWLFHRGGGLKTWCRMLWAQKRPSCWWYSCNDSSSHTWHCG